MKNRNIVIAIVIVIALVGLVLFVFKDRIYRRLKSAITGESDTSSSLEKEIKQEFDIDWQEWQDLAGFAFEYPSEATIDAHLEEEIYYAHLEIKKEGEDGSIEILCTDSLYVDIDEWLKEDELASSGSSLDTQVASMSAKKVALADDGEVTAFIDWDQVIYTINLKNTSDYWQHVYDKILSSFKLIPLEGESEEEFSNWLEGFDTSSADVVEPVEVVE